MQFTRQSACLARTKAGNNIAAKIPIIAPATQSKRTPNICSLRKTTNDSFSSNDTRIIQGDVYLELESVLPPIGDVVVFISIFIPLNVDADGTAQADYILRGIPKGWNPRPSLSCFRLGERPCVKASILSKARFPCGAELEVPWATPFSIFWRLGIFSAAFFFCFSLCRL